MEPLKTKDPKQVGEWSLVARLGVGGMGIVYLAARGTQNAALKVIHSHLTDDENWFSRFRREVEVLSKVKGDHVAQILDADLNSDPAWVATEFVNGPDLRLQVQKNGVFGEAAWFKLAEGLILAINEIHDAKIIHRDIKPGNILFTSTGPKIIDFGIALTAEATSLTSTGLVTGSPAWLAPEQIAGTGINTAADIFSLGSTLVFAALGRSPWSESDEISTPILFHRILAEPPNLDGLSKEQVRSLSKLLNKEPKDRPTAKELLKFQDKSNINIEPKVYKKESITFLDQKSEYEKPPAIQQRFEKKPTFYSPKTVKKSQETEINKIGRKEKIRNIKNFNLTKTSIHIPRSTASTDIKNKKTKKSLLAILPLSTVSIALILFFALQSSSNVQETLGISQEINEDSAPVVTSTIEPIVEKPLEPEVTEPKEEPPLEINPTVEAESRVDIKEVEIDNNENQLNSCEKGISCKIGDTGPAGGIIFYTADSKQSWGQYLEAAPRDIRGSHLFCNSDLESSSEISRTENRKAIGMGKANTEILLSYCTGGAVAKASQYSTVSNGLKYDDWFLPSEQELRALFKKKNLLTGIGKVAYWSSTEWFYGNGVKIDFQSGNYPAAFGTKSNYVRPIRAF